MNIVLASASTRRRELLEMLGEKNLKILPAQGEERAPEGLAPEALVMELATRKAREVAARCGAEDLVIGADTIVTGCANCKASLKDPAGKEGRGIRVLSLEELVAEAL